VAATTTTTAPPQQSGQQKQQQQDRHLIALIIAAFLAWHTAGQILAVLRKPFKAAGISAPAVQAAVGLVLSMPLPGMEGTGPATRWAIRQNEIRRASFSLNTCKRIQAAIDAAKAHDEPAIAAIQDALKAEQRWFGAHVDASNRRVQAASAVDGMAATYGDLLSWNAVKDKRCTPGCFEASGKNFRADRPPIVEGHPAFPGAVHGVTCRCTAGPPRRGAAMLPSS
jgi:hypothetical protein